MYGCRFYHIVLILYIIYTVLSLTPCGCRHLEFFSVQLYITYPYKEIDLHYSIAVKVTYFLPEFDAPLVHLLVHCLQWSLPAHSQNSGGNTPEHQFPVRFD